MKLLFSLLFICHATLLTSQTKSRDVHVAVEVDPVFDQIKVTLKTNSDSLSNCKVHILDSEKKLIKTASLPKATKQIDSRVVIPGLGPGHFTCFVYNGKVELYKGKFFKDAVFMEPQIQPAVRKSQN